MLFQSLTLAQDLKNKGERNADTIRQRMTSVISNEPLAKIEYVSIADAQTLEELTEIDKPAVASLAVRFGKTRLIDNILLEQNHSRTIASAPIIDRKARPAPK